MRDLTKTIKQLHEIYRSGDSFKAELGVRDALKTWPEDTSLLQLGALTALAINQVVTAHQRLDAATDRMSMTAELANIKGRVHKASADWAAAEKAYNLAEDIDPNFERARVNRLNLFTVSEQPKRVLDELDTGFDFGDMGEVARSQALTDLGRYESALEILENLKSETYQDQITFQRLKCFAGLGRLEDMIDAYEALPSISSLRLKALNVAVNSFEMRGHKKQSLEVIEKAIKEGPAAMAVQAIRLIRRIGQESRARTELENLSNLYPADINVLSEMANAARLDKNFEKSCELYRQALTASPGNFSILCGFAQASISVKRFGDAQTALQAALAQSPNNQFLLALVATLLRGMKQDHRHLYDYQKFVRAYDIGPPDGYSDITEFNAALSARLDNLHIYQHAPVNQTLRLGTQTEMDLSLIDDPVLNAFFKAIDAPIKAYMKAVGWDAGHPLRRRNTNAYRISGAWSVRLGEAGHHVNHVHPMGWLSSAYYVEVPPSVNNKSRDGWIKFGEPDLDIDQDAEHYVEPAAGRLVLFPSYMWHGTIPFTGPETRLTLPFDVVPA